MNSISQIAFFKQAQNAEHIPGLLEQFTEQENQAAIRLRDLQHYPIQGIVDVVYVVSDQGSALDLIIDRLHQQFADELVLLSSARLAGRPGDVFIAVKYRDVEQTQGEFASSICSSLRVTKKLKTLNKSELPFGALAKLVPESRLWELKKCIARETGCPEVAEGTKIELFGTRSKSGK